MSDSPARPMKYPYTISAKIAQFPLKYYIQNQWIWRYWMIGIAVATPVFYKIHKLDIIEQFRSSQNEDAMVVVAEGDLNKTQVQPLKRHISSNSPENVSKWAEMRKKEAASHHH